MKKISWLITVVAIAVVFFQCQKELHYVGGPDTGNSVTPDPIKASVQGNITDENDQPAAGVTVTAGTSTTITDDKGYFRFTNASLDKNTTLVTASKNGYFTGYRVFAATSGCNQVAIKLIKKTVIGSVASSSGGEVSLSNGSKVNLPASGIVTDASGSAYSGDVKVSSSYINPAATDISKTIPGSSVANSKEGKRVVISSYGMLAVELSSSAGDKLQIKNGSTATLSIPISSALTATAPATIPLWYLDEATGIWQEEGTATKQGNNYVGEVKHFSFWSAASFQQSVNLSLTLQTPGGQPVVNGSVVLSGAVTDSVTHTVYIYGYTDSLGQVSGIVPANADLTLDVVGTCNNTPVYTQTIPALTQDKDLGVIKITDNTSSLLTMTGTLQDCNNQPVSNGYAIVNLAGIIHYASADANGKFTTTFVACADPGMGFFVTGVDKDNAQQSETLLYAGGASGDFGIIKVCGSPVEDEYIDYTIDGTDYSMNTSQGDSLYGSTDISLGIQITGFSSSTKQLKFYSPGVASFPSTYDVQALYVNNGADSVNLDLGSKVTFTLAPSGSSNYYQGHFDNLSYWDSLPTVRHTISASFKVKKN